MYSVKLEIDRTYRYVQDERMTHPLAMYNAIESLLQLSEKTKEHFVAVALNTAAQIVGVHVIHIGTIDASLIEPVSVFQPIILNNAKDVILCHNHPSQSCMPSEDDVRVTNQLIEAGRILGITVLDHIIFGRRQYVSMSEKGYAEFDKALPQLTTHIS